MYNTLNVIYNNGNQSIYKSTELPKEEGVNTWHRWTITKRGINISEHGWTKRPDWPNALANDELSVIKTVISETFIPITSVESWQLYTTRLSD